MDDVEWTWIDMRWQQPGWREAFRVRLCGWLPYSWSKKGIEEGVIELAWQVPPTTIRLTEKGRQLTDPRAEADTEARRFLGAVLAVLDFQKDWVQARQQPNDVLLLGDDRFSVSYRDEVMAHFAAEAARLT